MNKKLSFISFFGKDIAEGNASMKVLLGGKGANLAEIAQLGIPVPPGFTITTEACAKFNENKQKFPPGLKEEILEAIQRLESITGKKLGDTTVPLLVSVRSGAAVSMPGMMDTILNLGLNDKAVEGLAESSHNERFAWDAYRRLINMFGNVVYNMNHHDFETVLQKIKTKHKASSDTDLDANALKAVVQEYKTLFKKKTKKEFPQNPAIQLQEAIAAVFLSWNNERAITYRNLNSISGLLGTAVNVQSMVFGNFGKTSGTGVAFSRDASTGEKVFYGEYLMNAQGEDVVAGIRTPNPISQLKQQQPKIYTQLEKIKNKLEKHYRDMQDIEFTIEAGALYLLQTRNGKRTGAAAVKIAVDMVKEKLISKEEALLRVSPELFEQVFHPMIDPIAKKNATVLAKGSNASPGAAVGTIVLTAEAAQEAAKKGKKIILVREQTSPEDIGGMHVVEGILTSTGGMTSHAAVVARGMGTPCVVGCKEIVIEKRTVKIAGKQFLVGDIISIDGSTGEVFGTRLPLIEPILTKEIASFLKFADTVRIAAKRSQEHPKLFYVRANADTPKDAAIAREWGAEGIGLCRTEHMFFEENRIKIFRQMILADTLQDRTVALKQLLPLQRKDFIAIFTAMKGYPVNIRLLDPPLHEFLPNDVASQKELAVQTKKSLGFIKDRTKTLHEQNPMLGHRGCRLGITCQEIYDMQVTAIIEAAIACTKKSIKVIPEIMIPLVGTYEELKILRDRTEHIAKQLLKEANIKIQYKIGTMIEVPRAALTANEIVPYADFFSFGTNDLTQLTYGYSREDTASFLPYYIEHGILSADPFAVLDRNGVGKLIQLGTQGGRSVKPDLSVGICGEHGGEPSSVAFAYSVGLNYVSCSPLRVPIARLAAAQQVAHDLLTKNAS